MRSLWLLLGGSEGRPFLEPAGGSETGLLIAAGIVSTVPLLCFTAAARRLAYSTVGMLQFIAPTLQFLLAVAVYGEPFTKRPCGRVRLHLDRSVPLCHLNGTLDAGKATERRPASRPKLRILSPFPPFLLNERRC